MNIDAGLQNEAEKSSLLSTTSEQDGGGGTNIPQKEFLSVDFGVGVGSSSFQRTAC